MRIHVGYELTYNCPQETPMILTLNVHYSRASDILVPDYLTTDPSVPVTGYRDGYGNWCNRIVAPMGRIQIRGSGVVADKGQPDVVVPSACQYAVQDLPEESLIFLLGSRYCETDRLSDIAWGLFSQTAPGWPRVQAICDFAHHQITFDYQNARATRTAWEAYNERTGVCRDYAHLAIALCRCMNIPARYCTGYLGDMGTAPPYGVGDFAAWMEVYLGGRWYTFDPRNNVPRMGRVLIARGRDAADVAITTTFGPAILETFKVWTDEVLENFTIPRKGYDIVLMPLLTVRHVTVYRYSEPVWLGEHRMMFRPRESHDLRLLKTWLAITPQPAGLRWLHDVFDNSVAIATFDRQATVLRFDSTVTLEHFDTEPMDYALEEYARTYPFHYDEDELPDLARGLLSHYPSEEVAHWTEQFGHPSGSIGTISLLRSITLAIKNDFRYQRRSAKGIQNPSETLRSGQGSCRDFALLMMEAVRCLGLAARFVSGYIFVPDLDTSQTSSGGATHAWMQVYLPGAGWVDFDPTNNIIGNHNLIPVAVAWDPKQALPLWGTYRGDPAAFLGMDVSVTVTEGAIS